MTEISQEAPALVGIGAQSIVDRAKELGLTWTIRPATVVTSEEPLQALNPTESIRYDGDTESIDAINLTGQVLTVQQRVMVIGVPPAANYIIGFLIPDDSDARGLMTRVSSTVQTGLISAETIVLSIPTVTLQNGRAYSVHWEGTPFGTVNAAALICRIRLSGTIGTLLIYRQYVQGGVGAQQTVVSTGYIVNTTGSPQTVTIVMTCQSGSGNVRWGTNLATDVYYLEVHDVGTAAEYTGAISV